MFDDAYKSPLSCIIVDDIERLLGLYMSYCGILCAITVDPHLSGYLKSHPVGKDYIGMTYLS